MSDRQDLVENFMVVLKICSSVTTIKVAKTEGGKVIFRSNIVGRKLSIHCFILSLYTMAM